MKTVSLQPFPWLFSRGGMRSLTGQANRWKVEESSGRLVLKNRRSDHSIRLGRRDVESLSRGVLKLRVQLLLNGPRVTAHPLPPGYWA